MSEATPQPSIPAALQQALAAILGEADPKARQQKILQVQADFPSHHEYVDRWLYQHSVGADSVAENRGDELPLSEAEERTIGPYTLIERIGKGGMGEVFVAEQKEPVQRRVALKLIKIGMDSEAAVQRFRRERQVLASMNHEAIAKVFDAGIASHGRPYFVMEYVEGGKPITDYCDEHRLSIPERIQLFQMVCQGVQHSHQRQVLHRDIKPANILVRKVGDRHVPKIIDFGLAKAIAGGDLGDGASVHSLQGGLMGTLAYMPPEQAAGEPDLTTAIDVYSLGVVLYELLSGVLPFDLRKLSEAEWVRRIREDEPKKPSTRITEASAAAAATVALAMQRRLRSVRAWSRVVQGDLDWIVLKAMAKEKERRYASATEFAEDLQRYLDHEPVHARAPSFGYRVSKFVRRYRGQVVGASFVTLALLGGAIATYVQYDRAEQKLTEFNLLSGVVLYERAIANEKDLYPAWPHKIEAMEMWRDDALKLLMLKPENEKTVRDLEERALPPTAEEQEADRRAHPRFTVFELSTRQVASLRYAQAIRARSAQLVTPGLSAEQQALDMQDLNTLAWERVAPPAKEGQAEQRKVYGEEALGLACARLAAAKVKGTPGASQMLDTLAWALVANGQDAAAQAASEEALSLAPEAQSAAFEGNLHDVQAACAQAPEILATTEAQLVDLTAVVSERRTFRFELESQQFLHGTLAELLGNLGSLAAKEKSEVDKRLLWAKQVQQLSLSHPNSRHTWATVRAAIAQNAKYAGQRIELRDQDITGLVPIGENPVTHLWEFYELRSAWDVACPPNEIPIPAHDPMTGAIRVQDDTGIVFVLLPGGTFTMGAQKSDPRKPNFDKQAGNDTTPHEVTLAPFFLARHEMTQAQWARLWNGAEILRWPSRFKVGVAYKGFPTAVGTSHPVENVDWEACDTILRHSGLSLPTESQWEFGCRAGSSTPWYTGDTPISLVGHANVLDLDAVTYYPGWGSPEDFADGFGGPAPVDEFQGTNKFDLCNMHGNVWEWCLDWYGSYRSPWRAGDGLRLVKPSSDFGLSGHRVLRGGCYQNKAIHAGSSARFWLPPAFRDGIAGVRAARALTP